MFKTTHRNASSPIYGLARSQLLSNCQITYELTVTRYIKINFFFKFENLKLIGMLDCRPYNRDIACSLIDGHGKQVKLYDNIGHYPI